MKNNLAPHKTESFYAIIACMESGENLNTDIDNDNTDFETANGWESLVNDESESMAALAAHALQKAKARDRIEQDWKHSEPKTPYRQQRKKNEQNLGHVGTSILDVRDKTTDRQAIRSEFNSWGVEDGDYEKIFRQNDEDYLDAYEADLRERREKLTFGEIIGKYNGLLTFLGENTATNPNIEQRYQAINGQKEKLHFILNLPLADKIQLFCSDSFSYANYDNFMHRLQFQQDFINGTAKVWTQEWDGHKDEYIDVRRPLDSSNANRDDILLGLNRASLKSAMIGTPEYGSYKMAMDIMRDRDWCMTPDFPEISGYWSGITNASIGSWGTIIDEYDAIASKVARRNPDMDEESLEYITVRKAAKIFVDSMEYNDADRGPESPYVSSFHESVAWAQLGYGVQRQLRGMRQKIMGSDLHNIERFIGKSGYSHKSGSFESERSRLSKRIDYINGLFDDDKQEFLAKENALEIKKQEEWREKKVERIQHKYEKLISKTRSEERRATYASRQGEEIQRVMADTSGRIEYFEGRTLDRLLSDINERRELLSRRIEKRKSLAEKAIDLHFATLPSSGNEGEGMAIDGEVDWINEAPFGLIKKAHRLLSKGLSQEELVIEIKKLQGFTAKEIQDWAVSQITLPSHGGGIGVTKSAYMKRMDAFLKEAIGEHYKDTDALDEIKSEFLEGLYVYENLDVSQIFSADFMKSDALLGAAKDHFFMAADSKGQLKYCTSGFLDKTLSTAGSFGPGSGALTIILERYILPNEPDFFEKKENLERIRRVIAQSAFLYNNRAIVEVHNIINTYTNNQDLVDLCDNLMSMRDEVKAAEHTLTYENENLRYPGLLRPSIMDFYYHLISDNSNTALPKVGSVASFFHYMIEGREEELDKIQHTIEIQDDALSAKYRQEIQSESVGQLLTKNCAILFSNGASFDKIARYKNFPILTENIDEAIGAGFLIDEIIRYPFLVSHLYKERNE